jgi:hypothetical protein
MNSRELVDYIRSGPTKIELKEPLRFHRRTRSSPCDFNEFLQALESSETIRSITCDSQLRLGITEDEWVLLVETIGNIRYIQDLNLECTAGSLHFRPFLAVADALNSARHLLKFSLEIGLENEIFPRDSFGLIALACALREHKTLRAFTWFDWFDLEEGAPRDLSLDPVLRALPKCHSLQEVSIRTIHASDGAMNTLLQLPKEANLLLVLKNVEDCLAVADEIRRNRCNVQKLHLVMVPQAERSEATEASKAVASAIGLDRHLKYLGLKSEYGFTDEAGVALAEALMINTTLREINLIVNPNSEVQDVDTLSAPAYDAFSAMLRINTDLTLNLPPFYDTADDKRLVDSHNQMRIEQELNDVGRGELLSSSQTTREDWVDALDDLNASNVYESPEFSVSCLYSLLRLHPTTCML